MHILKIRIYFLIFSQEPIIYFPYVSDSVPVSKWLIQVPLILWANCFSMLFKPNVSFWSRNQFVWKKLGGDIVSNMNIEKLRLWRIISRIKKRETKIVELKRNIIAEAWVEYLCFEGRCQNFSSFFCFV